MPESDIQRFLRCISDGCTALCFLEDEVKAGNLSATDAVRAVQYVQEVASYSLINIHKYREQENQEVP